MADSVNGIGNPVPEESRVRTRYAVIAGLAGISLIVGEVIQSTGQPKVGELTVDLISINHHVAAEIAGGVLNALGLLGLAITLSFLFVAVRARRPESAGAIRISALVGGVLGAAGGIADAVVLSVKAHDFVSQGSQTFAQANALVSTTSVAVLQYAGLIGSLLLAIAFVLVAMNAMRVGLLTRFLGYMGMVAAAASLFLIGSPIGLLVEVFWLLAVAYLLAGRWPGGDPRAWTTGAAEAWPSSAELREQRQQAAGRRAGKPPKTSAQGRDPVTAAAPPVRSSNPKRKRKRRR